jgi:hypothetical protein
MSTSSYFLPRPDAALPLDVDEFVDDSDPGRRVEREPLTLPAPAERAAGRTRDRPKNRRGRCQIRLLAQILTRI